MSSIFDTMSKLVDLMNNPPEGVGDTANAMLKTLSSIPEKLDRLIELSTVANDRLVEISLGLDTLADPIARPRFTSRDVAAAMDGSWPPPEAITMKVTSDE